MKHLYATKSIALASVLAGLALAGCGPSGSSASTAPTLSGVAAAAAPLGGASVTLKDSSTSTQQRNATAGGDGTFSFDVSGLQPPFLLQADWSDSSGDHHLHSVATQAGTAHVDPLTDAAVETASSAGDGGQGERDDAAEHERTATTASAFLQQLRTVLAPLFDLYGLGPDLLHADPAKMQALLHDVSFTLDHGTLLVTNRATSAVIFSGSVANLTAGTFHSENLPAGPGTTPTPTPTPPTACAYSYGAWGACQSDGTQTRTVVSSSPSGCTGTPVLSQACAYTPPTPAACQYTYGVWGACQSSGTQTRTVVSSSPSGCTGSPVLSQACTYTPPPPAACTYSYGAWGACQSSGTQTRTLVSSSPSGCTGTPVLSQACTYTPPPPTNPVTTANVVASCTGCHGLTSNTTVFKSGGYSVSGRSAAQWLSTVNSMVGMGASLAAGTTAQNYADFLANAP